MPADYPGSVTSFTTRVDLTETIFASHINKLQDEVLAIETTLSGPTSVDILSSTYDGTAHSFPTSAWGSVTARISNIERGLLNGVVGAPYVRKDLANTLSTSSGVSLNIKQTSGNSSNLLEARDSSNNLSFKLNSVGLPYVNSYEVLYSGPGSTSYQNILTSIQDTVDRIDNSVNQLLLTGM